MGWSIESCDLKVTVSLDEHGGDKEREHDKLWEEMRERLCAAIAPVVEDPRYAELSPRCPAVTG